MRSLLKWFAGIIGLIIGMIIIAIICLMMFINPNNLKTQLSKKVFDATGRQLIIGQISWTVYPWLGIKADHISLSNPSDFDNPLFAQADQAEIAAKLEPLFHGHVELGHLIVDGLKINLIKKANGVTNWQDFTDKFNTKTDPSISDTHRANLSNKQKLIVSISEVTFNDAQLHWENQQSHKTTDINNLQLDANNLAINQSFPLSLSFVINNNPYLNTVKMQTNIHISTNAVALNQLQAAVDNAQIDGNVMITDFSAPAYQFNLHIDTLNLNHHFSSNTSATTGNHAANSTDEGLLPIALFKKLNADGELSIDQLSLPKFTINHFYTKLNANNGLVQFNPLTGDIYQGQMTNNITINARNNTPQFNMVSSFTGIQIEPLLTGLADITRIKISGTGNLNANVSASGNSSSDIKRTLSGHCKFSINDGVFYGIDIPYYFAVADALLKKQLPTATNTHQTSFGNLTGTANIHNGLVSNNDLLISSPDLSVKGSGTADLVSEQLNYAMQMQRMQNGTAQGFEIPLMIKGTFSHPEIRPDVSEILKSQLSKQLEQQLSQKLQKTIGNNPNAQQIENAIGNSNVGKQLQKGLNSLFGQ